MFTPTDQLIFSPNKFTIQSIKQHSTLFVPLCAKGKLNLDDFKRVGNQGV